MLWPFPDGQAGDVDVSESQAPAQHRPENCRVATVRSTASRKAFGDRVDEAAGLYRAAEWTNAARDDFHMIGAHRRLRTEAHDEVRQAVDQDGVAIGIGGREAAQREILAGVAGFLQPG